MKSIRGCPMATCDPKRTRDYCFTVCASPPRTFQKTVTVLPRLHTTAVAGILDFNVGTG